MKKLKGFTLIEIMIVLAIIIIFISLTTKYNHQNNTPITEIDYYNDTDVDHTYIENNKRSYDTVTLTRHSDGQLYACDSDDVCKRIAR